jgi:hypothetical protein
MHHGTSMVQLALPLSTHISISELHGEYLEDDVLNKSFISEPGCGRNEHYPPELSPNYQLRLRTHLLGVWVCDSTTCCVVSHQCENLKNVFTPWSLFGSSRFPCTRCSFITHCERLLHRGIWRLELQTRRSESSPSGVDQI